MLKMKLLAVFLLTFSSFVILSGENKIPSVKFTDKPLKLDGKLLEDCWKSQTAECDFTDTSARKLPLATGAMAARSDSAVYFAATCAIPEKKDFLAWAEPSNRGAGMGKDDCMVFTLFPGSERDAYYAFYVNGKGAVWTVYRSQGGWVSTDIYLSDVRARAYRDSKNKVWSCELIVPFANLAYTHVPGKVWGWNAARIPRFEKGTFSLLQGKLFLPDARKDISGFDLDFSDFMLEVGKPEIISQVNKKHKIKLSVANRSGKRAQFRLQAALLPAQKISMGSKVTLAAAENKTVALSPRVAIPDGKYDLRVVIKDEKSRKILRTNTFPIVIDYTPWKCTLQKPGYRNSLFATDPDQRIEVKVETLINGKTSARLKDSRNMIIAEQSIDNNGVIVFDASKLAAGDYTVTLSGPVIDGKKSEALLNVRKLAYKKGEVWRDDEGFLRKDGKRIFVISEWNDVPLKDTNAIQMWGTAPVMDKNRMSIAFRLASSRFRKTYLQKHDRLSEEARAAACAVVKEQSKLDHLVLWQLSDEPESNSNGVKLPVFEDMYKLIRKLDPYHPVCIGSFTVRGMRDYINCYDVNFLHPYPDPILNQPRSCFAKVVEFMDAWETLQKERGCKAPVMLYLLQGFNYGDLIGNQRVPSYDELRTQTVMSLIAGGQGIMFYNRSAKFYPDLALGTPALARELRILEPVMVENNIIDPANKCPVRPFRWMIKKHKNDIWIFAGSFDEKTLNAEMVVPELGNRRLHVFGENRSLAVKDGKFSDTFKNFDTHIYTTNEKMAKAIDFAAVEQEIEKNYRRRQKPGNLAFQRHENEKLSVTSSSSIYYRARRSRYSALWHVTDGALEKGTRMYFEAAAPGTGTEFLELKFHKAVEANQVVIYPLNDSLCDYTVEVVKDGKYHVVAEVKNASGKVHTHTFATVKTDTIRIKASKSRSAMSIIEVEIYNR